MSTWAPVKSWSPRSIRKARAKRFDTELVQAVTASVNVPVIASGGYGEPKHLASVRVRRRRCGRRGGCLHYNRTDVT